MRSGRRIRCAAVLVAATVALTGFSSVGCAGPDSGTKKSGTDSNGAGGASSAGGSAGSGGDAASSAVPNRPGGPPARAEVLACVSPGQPLATVKVTSVSNAERTFEVRVTFESATTADVLDRTSLHVTLRANESRSVHVKMVDPGKAEQVKNCMVSVSLV